MKIRKAVVTAAGLGTRFLPATKAQPKEMLPLVDKPLIQHVVEEAVASGIEQVIIVTALGKRAIEDHFDRSFELEHNLQIRGQAQLLEEVRRISDLVSMVYIRQKEQLGLGHAVLTAEQVVGPEPFALMLPDDIIESDVPCLKQMLKVYERYQCSVLAVQRVAPHETSLYGILEAEPVGERTYRVLDLVEKPDPDQAPSNLAIVGRYILTPEIFAALKATAVGKGNEIQVTDALRLLRGKQPVYAYEFDGVRYDGGTPLGLLKASVELALRRPDLREEFLEYLRHLPLD
jgi:UTP--glucose-1-phosphate uridylyltransferase